MLLYQLWERSYPRPLSWHPVAAGKPDGQWLKAALLSLRPSSDGLFLSESECVKFALPFSYNDIRH